MVARKRRCDGRVYELGVVVFSSSRHRSPLEFQKTHVVTHRRPIVEDE